MIFSKLKFIANHFGYNNQKIKAIEELEELKVELNKEFVDRNKILDELSDCIIMIYQLIYLYGFSWKEIFKHIKYKIKRTIYRIEIGYYKEK